MEIFVIIAAVAFVGMFAERRDRKVLFPVQMCLSCPEAVYFNWGHRVWLHADGRQYKPTPGISLDHPALPSRINYFEEPEQ